MLTYIFYFYVMCIATSDSKWGVLSYGLEIETPSLLSVSSLPLLMCSNAPELCISVIIHFFSNDSHTQTRNNHGLIPSTCYFYLLMVSPLSSWVEHTPQCWASCLLHTLCLWELQSRPWAQKTCDSVYCPCLPPTLKAQWTEGRSLESSGPFCISFCMDLGPLRLTCPSVSYSFLPGSIAPQTPGRVVISTSTQHWGHHSPCKLTSYDLN